MKIRRYLGNERNKLFNSIMGFRLRSGSLSVVDRCLRLIELCTVGRGQKYCQFTLEEISKIVGCSLEAADLAINRLGDSSRNRIGQQVLICWRTLVRCEKIRSYRLITFEELKEDERCRPTFEEVKSALRITY